MQRINFLGCPVDSITMAGALEWMAECIANRRSQTITAINANKLWQMSQNSRIDAFVRNSNLIIPEWAVVWGAARLGTPLKAHVGGFTLLKAAIPWAEEHGYRPFFLGAKPEVMAKRYKFVGMLAWVRGRMPNNNPCKSKSLKTLMLHTTTLNWYSKSWTMIKRPIF